METPFFNALEQFEATAGFWQSCNIGGEKNRRVFG
jgi:hypothetical protein